MKNTATNKILVFGGIIAGASAIAYYANNKNKKYAVIGGVLGLLVATLSMPTVFKSTPKA